MQYKHCLGSLCIIDYVCFCLLCREGTKKQAKCKINPCLFSFPSEKGSSTSSSRYEKASETPKKMEHFFLGKRQIIALGIMKGSESRHLIIRVPTILPEFVFFFLSDGILFSSDVFCYHATTLATTAGALLNKGVPKDLW